MRTVTLLLLACGAALAQHTPSGPITLTAQTGTVINNLKITSTTGPCITITSSTNITIKNSEIGPCVGNAIQSNGTNGLTIVDSYIHPERTGVSTCCDTGDGIWSFNDTNVLIQGNVVAYGEDNILVQQHHGLAQVIGNFCLNSRNYGGNRGDNIQFYQSSSGSTATISNNYTLSSQNTSLYTFAGKQEDSINFVSTGPLVATASGNYVNGGTSGSGCGMIADSNANHITINGNSILDSGQCGIGNADGTNNAITNNKVLNRTPVTGGGNTAIYVWKVNANDAPCNNITITGNIAYEINTAGQLSGYWNGGGCEPVTFSGNTLDAAAFAILNPPSSSMPTPKIPPQPNTCTVVSPYTTQTSPSACGSSPTVLTPVITPSTDSKTGTVGTPFSYTINASNTPTSYGAVLHLSSGLPPGLSLTGAILSGTPTQANTYTIDLSATNSAGTGTATLTLVTSQPVSNTPNAASNAATTNVGDLSVNLTWTDNSSNETGFRIYRKQTQAAAQPFALVATVGANTTSYNDPGLTQNYSYDYQVVTYRIVSGTEYDAAPSNTSTVQVITLPTHPPVSDTFANGVDPTLWTVIDPVGNGIIQPSLSDGTLTMLAPGGSNHDPSFGGSDNSIRLIQAVTNGDMNIEIKLNSIPNTNLQTQGLLIEQDGSNFIRLEYDYFNGLIVSVSKIVANAQTQIQSTNITATGASLWLRMVRAGNVWSPYYSLDGLTFTAMTTFTQAYTVADVGPYVGNFSSTPSSAPAFTAVVDYFRNNQAPVLITVCASGCTYDNTQLQAAINAAFCGDTIQIQAGITYTGNFTANSTCPLNNPITITGSSQSMLPAPGHTVTRAYYYNGLMPTISTSNNTQALKVNPNGGSTNGSFSLIGVAFRTTFSGVTFMIVDAGPDLPNADTDLTDGLLVDRSVFTNEGVYARLVNNALRLNTRTATIKNSYFDTHYNTQDGNAIAGYQAAGPITATSNFLGNGQSECIIMGGTNPNYNLGGNHLGIDWEYNFCHQSERWYSFSPYWVSGQGACLKNGYECKDCRAESGSFNFIRYNGMDRSWNQGPGGTGAGCGNQNYGIDLTVRTQYHIGTDSSGALVSAQLASDNVTVTLPASMTPSYTNIKGYGNICLCTHSVTSGGVTTCTGTGSTTPPFQCRTVSVISGGGTFVMSSPYDSTVLPTCKTGGFCAIDWTNEPYAAINNTLVWGNFLQNNNNFMNSQGSDDIFVGSSNNVKVSNNVSTQTDTRMFGNLNPNGPGFLRMFGQTSNWTVEHNTLYSYATGTTSSVGATTAGNATPWARQVNTTFRSNLIPFLERGSIWGSGSAGGGPAVASAWSGNSVYSYNPFVRSGIGSNFFNQPAGSSPSHDCAPVTCSNLFFYPMAGEGTTDWNNNATTQPNNPPGHLNAPQNDFILTPGTPFFNAGHDAKSLGAETRDVALMKYVNVQPVATGVLLSWQLERPIAWGYCQVEVSSSSNLYSDVGAYSVVSYLDPAVNTNYIQDDVNPRATKTNDGMSRWFFVPGLTSSTTYYYLIMCPGSSTRGSFTTTAFPGVSPNASISYTTASGAKARIRYGQRAGSLTTSAAVTCNTGCTFSVPTVSGDQLVYYIDELDISNNVVYTGTVPKVLAVP